ncbi:MATE family efflux transporter [Ichthyobacterium seriolicida]|uniref:Multidrug-efflux transporter n=1 Tax=Ichthyobacterium seriolicida TaxID=242600 RepID=A0A1J1E2H4_9FLAO|nr:MATE family efflux transporter [Ichthyobacterium seriolicida]BAV94236.1 multidrug transporter [Ichthyobacterium seriolicida]
MRKYTSEFKNNLKIAYPIIIGQLGYVILSLTDNLMIGRLGAENLAASSLANGVFLAVYVFGLGVSSAITPIVAEFDGRGSLKEGAKVFQHSLILNIFLALFMISVLLCLVPMLKYFDQPERVIELTIPYLVILSISIMPMMIFQTLKQFAEGLANTKPAMNASLVGNLANIIFNYGLIFGNLGMPELGIEGAGYGTLIARIFTLASMLIIIYNQKHFRSYTVFITFSTYSRDIFIRIIKVGVPIGLQMLFEVGAFASCTFIAGFLGAKYIAAHQIALNLASISFLVITGVSAAASIRVANQKGKDNKYCMRIMGMSCLLMTFFLMTFFALVFFIFRDFLPIFYIADIEVIKIASSLLIIVAVFQITDGLQVVALGALRGMQDVFIPTCFTFIAYWFITIPLAYILGITMGFGIEGIWIAISIGLSILAIVFIHRFYKMTTNEPSAKVFVS